MSAYSEVVGALAAVTRPTAVPLAFLPSVAGALVGAVALVLLLRPLRGTRRTSTPARDDRTWRERLSDQLRSTDRKTGGLDRRAFLVTGLGAAAVAGASGAVGRVAIGRRFDVARSRAAVTLPRPSSAAAPVPTGADLRLAGPQPVHHAEPGLLPGRHRAGRAAGRRRRLALRVHGMVDRRDRRSTSTSCSTGALVERDITLTCVSNEVGGPYVGNARWLGVPLCRPAARGRRAAAAPTSGRAARSTA